MASAVPAAAQSEASLARLLSGRPARDAIAAQLGELWNELAKRPGARAAGAARAEAQVALQKLAAARDPKERERRRQVAWAALQRLDREVALAELADAVRTLEARAAHGDAPPGPGAAQPAGRTASSGALASAGAAQPAGRAASGGALASAAQSSRRAASGAQASASGSETASATSAPDLAARAQRAQRAAAEANDPEMRRDQAERARLLRAAAQAESQRVALERRAERAEQRMAADIAARAAAERAEWDDQRAVERAQASQSERREAERVFAALVQRTVREGVLPPQRAAHASGAAAQGEADGRGRATSASAHLPLMAASVDESPPTAGQAAAFLLRRAELTLAAANALGAPAAELTGAERSSAEAQAAQGAARLSRAERAHAAALRALGAARLARPVHAAQVADLLARAHERGFSAESGADAVVIRAAGAFAPGRGELRAEQGRRLQLLRELLVAFPHGPILIACGADAPGGGGRALAAARARRALEQLAQGPLRDRLRAEEASDPSPPSELRIRLPGYGAPAAAPTAQPGP